MRFYVLLMFHSENIVILTILLRYFDISVVGFIMPCITVFEIYCTSAVYTFTNVLPSPDSKCCLSKESYLHMYPEGITYII